MTIVTVLCVTLTWTHVVYSGAQGIHRGNWSFPAGTLLPFSGPSVPIGLARAARITVIRCISGTTRPTGIYRCDIQTIAVHDDSDNSVRDTVYVGLYTGSGGIMYCTFCPIIIHRVFQNLIFLFHRRCDNTRRYNSYCALWPEWTKSSINPHLYLHWRTCYHCHLDQRLHHCH